MTFRPAISVVVPSFQRPEALRNTVRQLNAQAIREEMEVIVAGQEYPSDFTLDSGVTFFNLPEASVTKAKNTAIRQARGEVILVLDDDLEFEPELVAQHLAHYQNPTIVAVGGKVVEPGMGRNSGLFPAAFGHLNFIGEPNTDFEGVISQTVVEVTPGGNLSFRKAAWKKIDGYDENFYGNSVNEDNDFCLRLVKAGCRIIFDPQISVYHQRLEGGTRGFGDVVDWYEQLFANHLYFFLKHFPKWRLLFFFIYRCRQELACLKYGRFTWRSWWAPIKGYWRGLKIYLGLVSSI